MPLSISNIFIFISVIFTFIASLFPNIYMFGMSSFFLEKGNFPFVWIQFILYSFLHWWIFHLFFNSIFIYYFWNIIEKIMGKKKYLIFFIWNTLFLWWILLFFSSANTVGISGFCMALLMYYTLYLKEKNDSEYKWWITAIIVNIAITIYPEISLLGHLFGAIFWGLFRLGEKVLKKINFLHKP